MTQPKECCEWNEAIEAAAAMIEKSQHIYVTTLGMARQAQGLACANHIRSLKRAPSQQANREWKLVPVEPTEEMMAATKGDLSGAEAALTIAKCHGFSLEWKDGKPPLYHAYKSMLAAAPSHQAGQEGIVGRLNAHIDASTKPDWRELAEASDRIETLEKALRSSETALVECANIMRPNYPSIANNIIPEHLRIIRNALDDRGG